MFQDTLTVASQRPDTAALSLSGAGVSDSVNTSAALHARADSAYLMYAESDSLVLDSLTLDSLMRDSIMQARAAHERDSLDRLALEEQLSGFEGEPLPFVLHRSDTVMGASLLAIMLVLFVVAKTRRNFAKRVSLFFYSENLSADDNLTHQDHPLIMPFLMLLFSIECSLLFLGYANTVELFPEEVLARPQTVGCYIAATVLFLVLKQGLYAFVNSVFFTRGARRLWRMHYSLLFFSGTVLLLPLMLLYVFSGIDSLYLYYAIALVLLFVNIFVIIKGYSAFFGKIAGVMHLFVYFCALEIAPVVFWWVALTWLTTFLASV